MVRTSRLAWTRWACAIAGAVIAAWLAGACANGSDASTDTAEEDTGACSGGRTRCGAECVDTRADPEHCGDCDQSCPAGQTCQEGACACPAGFVGCDDQCIDPLVDNQHCGASGACTGDEAGVVCAPGEICNGAGQCALTCQTGLIACEGVCIDPLNDERWCGAGPDCAENPGMECPEGERCDGTGHCALSCQAALVDCNGLCTDLQIDPHHCGDCAVECPQVANAVPVCAEGKCAFVCTSGFADCNLEPADGCEIEVAVDPLNCGECGHVCTDGTCSNGSCSHVVFVTSVMYDGNLGGLTGADALCQARAQAAGIDGTFMAWLSDSTGSPSTRFTPSGEPYVRVDGVQVADDWADLIDGTLDAPINVTELNTAAPIGTTSCAGGGFETAWSNTNPNGTPLGGALHCNNWTDVNATQAAWGQVSASNSFFTSWCTGGGAVCVWLSSLYCFQQ